MLSHRRQIARMRPARRAIVTNPTTDAAAELQDLLDRLGTELSRWPEAERERANQIVAASPEARRLLEEARALWDPARVAPVKAPPGLKERILDKALSSDKPCRGKASRDEKP